jgi:anti-sigma B factor antagonist
MNLFSASLSPSFLDESVTVFRLQGHLDAQALHDLERLYGEGPARGSRHWVMDLSKLEYISSAGLGSFMGVLANLHEREGELFFVGLSPKIAKIFRVLGMARVFKVFENEFQALEAAAGAPPLPGTETGLLETRFDAWDA